MQSGFEGRELALRHHNSNLIYECKFAKIEDPEILEAEIDLIPGVVESGLFIDLATKVVVASAKGVDTRSKN